MSTPTKPFHSVPSVLGYFRTGSREIVDPPVLDTDEDWVLLVSNMGHALKQLKDIGYKLTSSENYVATADDPFTPYYNRFKAMRRGEENLILVDYQMSFVQWKVATRLAKRLNIKDKEDRIALFRAIRSGGVAL